MIRNRWHFLVMVLSVLALGGEGCSTTFYGTEETWKVGDDVRKVVIVDKLSNSLNACSPLDPKRVVDSSNITAAEAGEASGCDPVPMDTTKFEKRSVPPLGLPGDTLCILTFTVTGGPPAGTTCQCNPGNQIACGGNGNYNCNGTKGSNEGVTFSSGNGGSHPCGTCSGTTYNCNAAVHYP